MSGYKVWRNLISPARPLDYELKDLQACFGMCRKMCAVQQLTFKRRENGVIPVKWTLLSW